MPMHIMVVDDEADVPILFRQRFRRELRANRIVLHFAASGETALDYLDQQAGIEIVLILSDINMPGMHGLELLQRLKSRDQDLTVFMITAYHDDDHYQMAIEYGADDYITKPIDFMELKQKICNL